VKLAVVLYVMRSVRTPHSRHETHLVVCQEAGSLRVRPWRASSGLFVNVRADIIVIVALAESEGTAIERDTNYKLVRRAAQVHPQLKPVIL
jgi:hypothetical protein